MCSVYFMVTFHSIFLCKFWPEEKGESLETLESSSGEHKNSNRTYFKFSKYFIMNKTAEEEDNFD